MPFTFNYGLGFHYFPPLGVVSKHALHDYWKRACASLVYLLLSHMQLVYLVGHRQLNSLIKMLIALSL